jgi:hypothetical protein
MILRNDMKDLIRLGDNFAEMEMPFRGTATNGMLLWLDEHLLKQWWKLSDAKVEPEREGMFYLRWSADEDRKNHAVLYGILDEIDTEANFFKVKKIIYVIGKIKLSGLELHVSFNKYPGTDSAIKTRLSHSFDPHMKTLFDKSVLLSWPQTFGLFRKFVES